jgi:hypothetical protein
MRSGRCGWMIALLALAAPAAWADWVVTKDGGKFEIKGGWELKGKMIVFTTSSGTLSSLRADRVDIEASKRATEMAKKEADGGGEAAEAARAEAMKPKKKSVRILTDKDFRKASPELAPDRAGDKAKDDAAAKPVANAVPGSATNLQVVKWDRVNPVDPVTAKGVEIHGRVQNVSVDVLTDLAITANFYDDAGTLVAKVPADIAASNLQAKETVDFTATAPGVYSFATVKFETKASGFKPHGPEAPPGDATKPPPSAEKSTSPPPPR